MMQKDMNLALELGRRARGAAADDRGDERAADRRARHGSRREGLRGPLRRPRSDVRRRQRRRVSAAAERPVRVGDDGGLWLEMYRRHGDDPGLRGAGQRPVPRREDARPRPPLHRRRGGRGRRLLGLAPRRLHHQHPPRSRPLPGQGRRRRADVRGAARPRARLLPRQGRLDAHRRPREREPRRQRDRRRLDGDRDRRGVLGEASRHRPGRRLLLRRRRARAGPALRGDEHGFALGAARHLRLREQPLQRVHPLPRGDGGRDPRPPDGVRDRAARGRRPGRPRGLRRSGGARRARARRRWPRIPPLQHLSLPRPPRRRRRSRVLPREGRGAALAGRARPADRCTRSGSPHRDSQTTPGCARSTKRRVRSSSGARRLRSTHRFPIRAR